MNILHLRLSADPVQSGFLTLLNHDVADSLRQTHWNEPHVSTAWPNHFSVQSASAFLRTGEHGSQLTSDWQMVDSPGTSRYQWWPESRHSDYGPRPQPRRSHNALLQIQHCRPEMAQQYSLPHESQTDRRVPDQKPFLQVHVNQNNRAQSQKDSGLRPSLHVDGGLVVSDDWYCLKQNVGFLV